MREVIDEARTSGAKVHFASMMDICHLKNAELEAKHQKFKGRVVLQGDIVKDDSGSYAVFTEQGASSSQMRAAKSHGYHIQTARMRRTSSVRSICLHPSENGRCSQIIENSKIGVSRHLDSVEGLYPAPHIHEQMTTSYYGYDIAYNFTHNNIMLEHNAMNNIDTVAHMNVHNTQY